MKKKPDTLPNGPDRWHDQHILFCGHAGYFKADIIVTPFAVTILSRLQVLAGTLQRKRLDNADWHITDVNGDYWNPTQGIFVLPRESVTKLDDTNRKDFL